MGGEAFHPAHRPGGRTLGDLGLPLEPRPLALLPVILVRPARGERTQHPGMRRRIPRLGLRQLPQAIGLHRPRQVGGRDLVEEGQAGAQPASASATVDGAHMLATSSQI